jgi:hypothetical protein
VNQLRPLKIGVLTFHRCINYGSYWQARCLVEDLIARGHNATILDHYSARVNIAEWKCAFRPTLPAPVPETDCPLYRQKITKFFQAFEELPLSRKFRLNQPNEMEDYDIIVVGSDEVWNLFHAWYGKCPLFFGDGLRAETIIAYAASFGNYPVAWGLSEEWANKLYNFDAISVRSENAELIVKNATGIDPEIVLDPCLQFQMNFNKRSYKNLQEPYIAVYGHNFSDSFIERTKDFSIATRTRTISIGYRNDWADENWLVADPHDFANFMEGAQAVATNFFHGCIFSLRNEKPFVCEITPYRSQKIEGLMHLVGAETHLVREGSGVEDFYNGMSEPLQGRIIQKLNDLRETSNEYLDSALGTQQHRVA